MSQNMKNTNEAFDAMRRQVLRLRWMLGSALTVLIAIVLIGMRQERVDTLRASAFNVVDDDNVPLAALRIRDGNPELVLSASDNASTLRLAAEDGGAKLEMLSKEKVCARLSSTEGKAELVLLSSTDRSLLRATLAENRPTITFEDAAGHVRLAFGLNEQLEPIVSLVDSERGKRIVLQLIGQQPSIRIYGADDRVIWTVPGMEAGNANGDD